MTCPGKPSPSRRGMCPGGTFLIAGLLTAHAGLLALSASLHSPPSDEMAHFASGLFHWRTGRFDLYRVNPPLVRLTATLPLLFAKVEAPSPDVRNPPGARREFDAGRSVARANGSRVFWLLLLARWACIPFSLLGAVACYLWARDLYGPAAGLLAVTLWCFCPNILGHGQFITPDVGAAAFGVLSGYTFWSWLRRPSGRGALVAGTCLGLAELCKTTWLVLFAIYPLAALFLREPGTPGGGRFGRRHAAQLALMLAVSLYVISLGYLSPFSFPRLGDFDFVSHALGGPFEQQGATVGNRFRGTVLGLLPVPLPAAFLSGVDEQVSDFEGPRDSYLRGQWRTGGWWYYYAYAALVKVPLGVWALLALAAFVRLRRGKVASWRTGLLVLAPAAAIFALVSSQTGFNHHFRYVLPALPFLHVWTAAVAVSARNALARFVLSLALSWAILSSLMIYPHSLSYFNELAGGPRCGPHHLLNSNIDWGQDLFFLRCWLDAHPEASRIHLAYWGDLDPALVGIRHRPIPSQLQDANRAAPDSALAPGWYGVSVNELYGRSGDYAHFRTLEPVSFAGYSIYIYHILPADKAAPTPARLPGTRPPPAA